jgi:hypothetical protein
MFLSSQPNGLQSYRAKVRLYPGAISHPLHALTPWKLACCIMMMGLPQSRL